VKRRAESIASGFEDVSLVIRDAMLEQRIVARERRAHRHSVRFPQLRAALDVGKEQRDGAGGRICHRLAAAEKAG
jgi:hypothetical protein